MHSIVSEMDDARTDDEATAENATAAATVSPRLKRRAAKGNSAAGRRSSKANNTRPPSRHRVAEGIYKNRHGLTATVKVNGIQHEVHFPAGRPLKTIRARRDELRGSLRTLPDGDRHTPTHDAGRYLDQVKNTLLVSLRDRRPDLAVWASAVRASAHARPRVAPRRSARAVARLASDARRVELQPPAARAHPPGTPALRSAYRRRPDRSRSIPAGAAEAPLGTPHTHRRGPRATDARIEDMGPVRTDALDGHAAIADAASDPYRLPP